MRSPLLLVIVALALALPALAALPPQRPEDLAKNATHIVVGKVEAVYITDRAKEANPDFADRLFLIEFTVTTVEKGDGPATGKVLYAKCWKPAKRPQGWAGPQGQNEIPKPDQSARLFLTRADDGSYSLLMPNGWDPVTP